MLDNTSLDIERRALIDGSYIEAIKNYIAEKDGMDEYDVVETIHPILREKVKMEFLLNGYFPNKKITNSLDNFL